MTTYYASTYFYQNDQEFQVDWDLTATKDDPTEEETISHLAAILEENWEETWGLEDDGDEDEDDDEEGSLPSTLNLFGLSPKEFARQLVLNTQEAEERFGVTWTISTRWEEVDSDNWEHPCNL
jgi:hypothetical protein